MKTFTSKPFPCGNDENMSLTKKVMQLKTNIHKRAEICSRKKIGNNQQYFFAHEALFETNIFAKIICIITLFEIFGKRRQNCDLLQIYKKNSFKISKKFFDLFSLAATKRLEYAFAYLCLCRSVTFFIHVL